MEQYFCNRLLDIAHSRYRPEIAIKYKHLYCSLDTVTHTEQLFQHIYLVTEKTKTEEQQDMAMELGVYSCIKGYVGATCKHQAAVANNFTIPAVNLPPFHAKEARRLYAILPRGQSKVMEIKFCNDLREESSEEDISLDINNDECDDNFSPVSSENADDITDISVNNSSTSTMTLTSKQIQDY